MNDDWTEIRIEVPKWLQLVLWCLFAGGFGRLLGIEMFDHHGPIGFVLGALGGGVISALALGLAKIDALDDGLMKSVAPMLEGGRVSGAQAAGDHRGLAVRFWSERGARSGELQLNCSVRAARGDACLESVEAHDLGIEPFAGPGDMVVRRGGIRAAWTSDHRPSSDEVRAWVASILAEADARRVPEAERIERLIELVEDGRASALDALVVEDPEHPRLAELAERLTERPEPAARFVGARWLGAEALEAAVDALADAPIWQAKALRARAEVAELPSDAIQRWAGVPGLRLELLIDHVQRGPIEGINALVDAAPEWTQVGEDRLQALADALVERGAEVERAARRLFDGQPAGRRDFARTLGEIGGMPSLSMLRSARDANDGPPPGEEAAAVDGAIARLTHRLGDAAAGMLALDEHEGDVGRLSLDAGSAGGMSVAGEEGRG